MPRKRRRSSRKPELVFTESPVLGFPYMTRSVMGAEHPITARVVPPDVQSGFSWVSPNFDSRARSCRSARKVQRREASTSEVSNRAPVGAKARRRRKAHLEFVGGLPDGGTGNVSVEGSLKVARETAAEPTARETSGVADDAVSDNAVVHPEAACVHRAKRRSSVACASSQPPPVCDALVTPPSSRRHRQTSESRRAGIGDGVPSTRDSQGGGCGSSACHEPCRERERHRYTSVRDRSQSSSSDVDRPSGGVTQTCPRLPLANRTHPLTDDANLCDRTRRRVSVTADPHSPAFVSGYDDEREVDRRRRDANGDVDNRFRTTPLNVVGRRLRSRHVLFRDENERDATTREGCRRVYAYDTPESEYGMTWRQRRHRWIEKRLRRRSKEQQAPQRDDVI
ncbi:PREDICTED: uncharacterized protein LOC106817756 [Priapulus caudatus]|uniref:Uncharacterized protein LOC106817756 n=1 Tax=Priapulus caudatus TaxID=37621 RepID=A0ABM1F0G8_PRICU|nr:PREDICTED: uncharacterized protein LOC106817756 [Priapulus caudatus]